MAEANGVFVKIFRDKGKENQFETQLQKSAEESRHRMQRAAEIRLTRLNELPNLNRHIDPKDFYPMFQDGEWDVCQRCLQERGYSPDVYWPQLTEFLNGAGKCYNGHIPTAILDEAFFAQKYGFFEYITLASNLRYTASVLIGRKDGVRYWIAYWGCKEVYDKIQQKLSEIETKKRAELEAAKWTEEEKAKNVQENTAKSAGMRRREKWSLRDKIIGISTSLALVAGILWGLDHYSLFSSHEQESGEVVVEPMTPDECSQLIRSSDDIDYIAVLSYYKVFGKQTRKCQIHGEHFILDCQSKYSGRLASVFVGKEVFNSFKVGDTVTEKKKENPEAVSNTCSMCEIKAIDSVYMLPSGSIFAKKNDCICISSCPKCPNKIYVLICNDPYNWIRVTESVFNKVKIGDKIPFKRPEY